MKALELPPEILLEILLYTPFLQKQECMLVCRKWAYLIRKHILFHSVTIWEKFMFKQYVELIMGNPSMGSQVERLVLFNCLDNKVVKKQYICTLFPKTRYIHIRQLSAHGIPTPPISDKTRQHLQSFRHHIEHVVDYNKAEFIFYLLTSGACLQLTTLEVELSHDVDMVNAFAQLLNNAPNIKTLKIVKSLMLLEALEKIHANLPSLESLSLHDVRIISTHTPAEITPAANLKELSFHDEMPWSRLEACWLEYVYRKYPNLLHLTLSVTPVDLDAWTLEEATVFTREDIMPIVRCLGPRLKRLKIYGNTLAPTVFEDMDSIGCQIMELDVNNLYKSMTIYPLVLSNQCRYIQSLSLRDLVMFDFELLGKELPVLKDLELFFKKGLTHPDEVVDKRLDLGLLLEHCPNTLVSVLISGTELTCKSYREEKRVFELKKLVVGEPWFHEEMSEFLSTCCPKLTTLILYNCGLNDIVLKLPNHKLSLFEVNQSRPDYIIALQVTIGTKSRFYSSDTKLPGVFNTQWGLDNVEPPELAAIKAISYKLPLFGVPFIELECASVFNLIINRRLTC
ncbi:hypothetical protein K501DRAFT_314505 [Backusella circina FSU 941]|nr:hypothetical protein K501DRAFT_314505 [Backusella circina FSU 941]